MIVYECEDCGAATQVEDVYAGAVIACRRCGRPNRVPLTTRLEYAGRTPPWATALIVLVAIALPLLVLAVVAFYIRFVR